MRPFLALALIAGPALADGPCAIGAYSDPDAPGEPEIRAAPDADEPVLGHAPRPPLGSDIEGFGSEFLVVEVRDGWARVEKVSDPEETATGPDGWIDARLVAFTAQTQVAFAGPDPSSDPVWTGRDWPYPRELLDCAGEWARIRFDDMVWSDSARDFVSAGIVTGWVRGICMNQWTTCEGLNGDWAKDHGGLPDRP